MAWETKKLRFFEKSKIFLFVAEYAPLLQPTLDVWKRRCFRKTAFWCYGKRDKCLDALCKDITGGVRGTLVAFGGEKKTSFFSFKIEDFKFLLNRLRIRPSATEASSSETGEDPRSESVHRRRMLHQPEVLSMSTLPLAKPNRGRRHLGSEALRPLQVFWQSQI